MGLDTTVTKLEVFALSSAIAAVGGALLAGLRQTATAGDYTMFYSLPVVLLAVLGGITAVSGGARRRARAGRVPRPGGQRLVAESLAIFGPGIIGITLARRPTGSCSRRPTCGRAAIGRGRPEPGLPERIEELGITIPFAGPAPTAIDHQLAIDAEAGVVRRTGPRARGAPCGPGTAGSRCCTASTSWSPPGRWSPCSAPTAPASRRPSGAVSGQHPAPTAGCVHMAGRGRERRRAPTRLARAGVCRIPEGRGVFPNLTVDENLLMATYAARCRRATSRSVAFARFPRLRERRRQLAGTLSGGEQQMLALARGPGRRPALLLLDELSMGLAPLIVEQLYEEVAAPRRRGRRPSSSSSSSPRSSSAWPTRWR